MAVKDTRLDKLTPIIACKVQPDSITCTDSYRSYDVPDITDFHHYLINHSKLFADKNNHINGIENFWNQAKRHLRKYNPVLSLPKEVYQKRTSTYSLRNANGVSIMGRQSNS